ncbi:MAG: putative Zn finger-like uncharacterized protein [Woeseiaceae bacterium]|jgi:predicted Zn finger-like uncharacterized protein
MYTQCPECQISFRVTARVLQQAGGKVRCGGCGNAFSALDHLSEDMPDASQADDGDSSTSDNLEETSRRLLQTLDELAGPEEVRIEDTGIEWRVLEDADEAIAEENLKDSSDTGSLKLHDDDDDDDDENIAGISSDAESESAEQESLDLEKEQHAVPVERRYDDNTPLPDDFEDEDDVAFATSLPQRRESDLQEDSSKFDEAQGDLALSEPGEWTDLLDEVGDADAIPLEVEEELAAIHSQLSTRETTEAKEAKPAPSTQADDAEDDEPASPPIDLDSQFELQAEALGITGTQQIIEEDKPPIAEEELTDEMPLLDDSYAEKEDSNIDLSAHEIELSADDDDIEDDVDEELEDFADDADEESEAIEDEDNDEIELLDDKAEVEEPRDAGEYDLEEGDAISLVETEANGEFDAQIDVAAKAMSGDDDDEPGYDEVDDDFEEIDAEVEIEELAFGEAENGDLRDDVEQIASDDIDDPVVDLDLASEGQEDEDQEDKEEAPEDDVDIAAKVSSDDELAANVFGTDHASKFFDENSGEVETIIMEGESVRGGLGHERIAAEEEARARISEASKLADTYAMNRGKMRGGRRNYDPPSYVIVIGSVLLAVGLLAQIVHASRDSLATSELFNQTVAPIYRILGQPITPEWDIKGWQFQSTNGSTDENEEVLTLVSRIGNESAVPLPYPLVHVSLTDRWEEIIGSRVLEPNEYLAGDLDPSKPVTPGENFTAVISIENPSQDATGFKLNVCYRVTPGRVRCAIEDFKD